MDVASAQLQVDMDCPYVGLCYFDEEHARFFFGRESDAELIAANVLSCGVMILHGPSGVGKSSVLSAALPAALQKIVPGALVVAYRRWDAGFYEQLLHEAHQRSAQALTALPAVQEPAGGDASAGAAPYMGMQDGERRGMDAPPDAPATHAPPAHRDPPADRSDQQVCPPDSLPASLEQVAQAWDRKVDTPFVFVFDQFEQYFTGQDFGRTREDDQFEADLARIVRLRDIGCHVMLSIREDALFELNRLRARIPNILARSLKLDFLDPEAAQEAIEGPLGVWRSERNEDDGPTRAAPDMIEALIRQVSRQGDAARIDTPYLQLALKRLWQEERRQGSPELRRTTLDALGGADGIAERHFRDTMKALPEDERRLCAVVLERMVTPSGMKIALTAGDLAQMTGENDEQVTAVLDRLADGRSFIIHKVASPQQHAAPLFEIFHDVLARPIRDWIAAEHERIEQEQKLAEQRRAADEERRQQQAELERQRAEAEREQQRHQEELARKQQQLAREKQMKRRYRSLAVFACVVAVAALAAFGYGVSSHRDAAAEQGRMLAKQAERELEAGDGRMALLLTLDALPSQSGLISGITAWLNWPDRDFAQRVLYRALASPVGLGLPSTSGRLTLAAFAPDGRSIVTASEQGTIELWSGEAVAQMLSGHDDKQLTPAVFRNKKRNRITALDFEASGKRFVTADGDGDVYVWDASYPKEPMKSWDVSERPAVAAISADGSLIATASYGSGTPTLWRPFGGPDFPGPEQDPVPWQTAHKYGITSIAFDAAGKRLVTTSFDGTAAIWRVADGKLLQAFTHGGASLLTARFSRDGRRLATAAWDGSVRIWSLGPEIPRDACPANKQPCFVEWWAEKVPLLTLDHPDMVTSLAFDGSGRQIVTASLDGAARVWNTDSGALVRRLQGPAEVAGRFASASISPDGGTVLATFMQRVAHFWPLQAAARLPMVENLPARPLAIATDGSADRVAVATDTRLEISDAATGEILRTIPLDRPPLSVVMSPGGLFVAAAVGRTVGIWSVDDQAPTYRELPDRGSLVLSVAYDRLGQRLITAYQDGSVRLWDATGRPLFESKAIFDRVSGRTLAKRSPVFAAVFGTDGSEIFAGSFDGRLRVADAAIGSELPRRTIMLGRPILGLQAADDGRRLVVDILDPPEPSDGMAVPDDRFRVSLQILDAKAGGRMDAAQGDADRYRELLQSGNGLQVANEAGDRTIVAAPLDRRLRLGPLPPEDASGQVAYARQVRLSALPVALRQLSEEEREERGLTTRAARKEPRGETSSSAAAAMAAAAPR